MSASFVTQRRYDGRRNWLLKIALANSPPVITMHSWPRRAPIGCMDRSSGRTSYARSIPACDSSMRGSVS